MLNTATTEDDIQILIIDDESEIVEEISEKLEFHGFEQGNIGHAEDR